MNIYTQSSIEVVGQAVTCTFALSALRSCIVLFSYSEYKLRRQVVGVLHGRSFSQERG